METNAFGEGRNAMAPRRAYGAPIILDLGAIAPAAWQ
jgi:hypothetical protein